MLPTFRDLGLRDAKDLVVVCYKLVPGNSASQPFILQTNPTDSNPVSKWEFKKLYGKGDVVLPSSANGHYYKAIAGGVSGDTEPKFATDGSVISDNAGLKWKDMGALAWEPNHPYKRGDVVIAQADAGIYSYYQTQNKGVSSDSIPTFTRGGTPISEPSGLIWKELSRVGRNPNSSYACSDINPTHPLLMNQVLIVAVDMTEIPAETQNRFKILNLNMTNQQGAPLNPTPMRPSITAATASGSEVSDSYFDIDGGKPKAAQIYFLTWPNQIPGDAIPTVTVNLVYTPVATALPWEPHTFYPAGTIVTFRETGPNSIVTNGHYYLAVDSGTTSTTPPAFNAANANLTRFTEGTGITWSDMGVVPMPATPPAWTPSHTYRTGDLVIPPTGNVNGHYYIAVSDGQSRATPPSFSINGQNSADGTTLLWKDMGAALAPPLWQPKTAYAIGAQVMPNPANGHYYVATQAGVTGANAPAFPVNGSSVIESSGVAWLDAGSTMPTGATLKAWAPATPFFLNDAIQDPSTGHYFIVIQPGISGPMNPPAFKVSAAAVASEFGPDGTQIRWQDIGTTLPASTTIGTTPSDLTVNLLNYTFPQAHALSYFNIASGVVVSSIQNRSFVFTTPPGSSTPVATKLGGGPMIDPILALSVYIKPLDAERKWRRSDLIPAPTLAFSLTSPSNNFYFGASSEVFVRNLQVTYGFSVARVPELAPAGTVQGSTSLPATKQGFAKGAFVGVSFNILGFIQSVF